jgi:thiamine kinase
MMGMEKPVLARGRTAEVLAWKDQQVLKLFYAWVSTEAIERETQIARLVSVMDLPTPKLLDEVSLGDRHGLIYERVVGTSLLTMLGTHPLSCMHYGKQFAELHAAIHCQHGNGLPPLKASLENTIRDLKDLPYLVEPALQRLGSLPEGEKLCHMDFHPDQVMVTSRGQSVLDWMTARRGPPAADVARTIVLLRFGPVMNASLLMQILVNLLRGMFFRTYLQHYLELNPVVTTAMIDAWLPIIALARLAEDIPGEKGKLHAFLQKTFRQ